MWDLPARFVRNWLLALVVMPAAFLASFVNVARAQREPLHYFHSGDMPPGAIGRGQLLRGGPLPGYFQPVELSVPKGVSVSIAVQGQYTEPQKGGLLAGMLIGQVYRLRVTGLPVHEEAEVFPTIEVLSRLHPPPGQETRFPIPIHLTEEELGMAISGRFVTRVIYLEDPTQAVPVQDTVDDQRFFEIRPDQDPLKTADELGRPMAILRMGSRVPDTTSSPTQLGFNYGSPPVRLFEKAAVVPRDAGLERPEPQPGEVKQFQQAENKRFPRMPLPGEKSPTVFTPKPQVLR